jgi:hypothetical protein
VSPTPSAVITRTTGQDLVRAVAWRPDLWWTALGVVRRLAPPGWWASSPRLPLPDQRLWEFRMVTAYGSPDAEPEPGDFISYLEWCRSTVGPSRLGRLSRSSQGRRGWGGTVGGSIGVRVSPPNRLGRARSG